LIAKLNKEQQAKSNAENELKELRKKLTTTEKKLMKTKQKLKKSEKEKVELKKRQSLTANGLETLPGISKMKK
jgi:peptidoglycan hydrolase CwlO-like protein